MDRGQLQDLIQADLDGELSVAERADLARLLLRDPQARNLHEGFRRTDQLLRDIPAAEPPPGLRAAILAGRSLSERRGDPARSSYGLPAFRLAAAVLGGLLIVGLAYVVRDGDAPGSELQGSLGRAGDPARSGLTALQDQWSFQAEGVELDASLRRAGQLLRLELDVSSAIHCELIARVDPSRASLVGGPDDAHLMKATGLVTVEAAPGRRSFVLEFSGVAPIQLQLHTGGQLLGEGELSVRER